MLKNQLRIGLLLVIGIFLSSPAPVFSQGMVSYRTIVNGKEIPRKHPLQIIYNRQITSVGVTKGQSGEKQFIDYRKKAVVKTLQTAQGTVRVETPFDSLQQAVLLSDTATIAGYLCHKAELVIRSNHIEVWYTNALPIKGSPSPEVAPYLGLVLKMVRNGNYEIRAAEVVPGPVPDSTGQSPPQGRLVDEAVFQQQLIQSRYTTIPVFTGQKINFGDTLVNPAGDERNKTYRFSGGTVVAKKIHLPENFSGNIFASLTQYSNGDAYDRTGCIFIIPQDDSTSFLEALKNGIKTLPSFKDHAGNTYQGMTAAGSYQPPVELIRFFTPFGVGAYNHRVKIAGYPWADSVTYVQDVTDMGPLLRGDVWIGAYIGNYDKNGHTISLHLNFYPGNNGAQDAWVLPLFNTLNIMEMSGQNYARFFRDDSLKMQVFLPDGIDDLRLRYISTGHGGWGGGDEFNPRENTILIDGKVVFAYTPWRTDCATYRLDNPSSGNFGSGLSSSDLSRSGWCPGTATNPVYVPLPHLKPGWHTLTVTIPEGRQEGTSFSFWNVSGSLTGKLSGQP